jgi:hypothetical protein
MPALIPSGAQAMFLIRVAHAFEFLTGVTYVGVLA